eukprot:363869-Chlamydomonas_euryale.AAC.38
MQHHAAIQRLCRRIDGDAAPADQPKRLPSAPFQADRLSFPGVQYVEQFKLMRVHERGHAVSESHRHEDPHFLIRTWGKAWVCTCMHGYWHARGSVLVRSRVPNSSGANGREFLLAYAHSTTCS